MDSVRIHRGIIHSADIPEQLFQNLKKYYPSNKSKAKNNNGSDKLY